MTICTPLGDGGIPVRVLNLALTPWFSFSTQFANMPSELGGSLLAHFELV